MMPNWALHSIRVLISLSLLFVVLSNRAGHKPLIWKFGHEVDSGQLHYLKFSDGLDSQSIQPSLWNSDSLIHPSEWKQVQYWAALRLADYTFGQTRFQFPNGESQPYNQLDLDLSRSHHDSVPFQCRERCLMYLDLCKRYIGIPGRVVDIPQQHSFPLVRIGQEEFMIDPYDPLVQISPLDAHIMPWSQVKSGEATLWVRSRREFGPTYELLSQALCKSYSGASQLMIELETEFELLLDSAKQSPNPLIPLHGLRQLRKTQSSLYPYAISLWDRQSGDDHLADQYGLKDSIEKVFRPSVHRHPNWQ